MVKRMSIDQKAMSMTQQVPSFTIADGSGSVREIYNAECLHGPHNTGYVSTVFPVPISLAATFDADIVTRVAQATSDALRSEWNKGSDWTYCFAPDINLVRDPRYGRGQETWGEDPWLAALFGKSFVVGLQNGTLNIPGVPEVAATCKHWVAYSGGGGGQGYKNAVVDAKNLYESFLPAWEGCAGPAKDGGGGAMSVMCSYGLVNGVPTCGDAQSLLVLRDELGFGVGWGEGYDGGTIPSCLCACVAFVTWCIALEQWSCLTVARSKTWLALG
jgi:beta-glucosidase